MKVNYKLSLRRKMALKSSAQHKIRWSKNIPWKRFFGNVLFAATFNGECAECKRYILVSGIIYHFPV